MADAVMVLTMTAFIAICVVYVRWCDHLIGPDPAPNPAFDEADAEVEAGVSRSETA